MTDLVTPTRDQIEQASAAKNVVACALGLAALSAAALWVESRVDGVLPSGRTFAALYAVALGAVAIFVKSSRPLAVLAVATIHLLIGAVDLKLTLQFIVHGTIQEANPIAAFTIATFGSMGAVALKLLCTALPAALMFTRFKDHRVVWVAVVALATSALIALKWSGAIQWLGDGPLAAGI